MALKFGLVLVNAVCLIYFAFKTDYAPLVFCARLPSTISSWKGALAKISNIRTNTTMFEYIRKWFRDKDFLIGFVGWFALNMGLLILDVIASNFIDTNWWDPGRSFIIVTVLNIIALIASAFIRPRIALGILVAFAFTFAISICLGCVFAITCFIMLNSYGWNW